MGRASRRLELGASGEWEWRKHGPCQRCGHQMTVRLEASTVVFGEPLRPVRAFCNCAIAHPGNPAPEGQRRGCGQYATIPPPVTSTR